MVSAAYFFYAYMSAYVDVDFVDQEKMGMMVLYFVQFGIALGMKQCGAQEDDHGFSSNFKDGGFSTVLEGYFTLDVGKMSRKQLKYYPFTDYIAKMFSLFGQSDSSSETDNATTALLGTLGIMGA